VRPDAVLGGLDFLGLGAEVDIHVEVLSVELDDLVAERFVALDERAGEHLQHGEVHVGGLAEVGDEFETDVAQPDDDARVLELGRVEHLRAGVDGGVLDARDRREVHVRPRSDHDVVRFDRSVADRQFAVADELGRVVDELDVLALGQGRHVGPAMLGEPRDVLVLRLDDLLDVHVRQVAGQAVIPPRGEAVLGRREDFLGGHAAPQNAEPAAGVAVVDQRQFHVRFVSQVVRDRHAGATVRADDGYVRAHTSGFGLAAKTVA